MMRKYFSVRGFGLACTIGGLFALAQGLSSVLTPFWEATSAAGLGVRPVGILLLVISFCLGAYRNHKERLLAQRGFEVVPPVPSQRK
jgi:hypothetical protein